MTGKEPTSKTSKNKAIRADSCMKLVLAGIVAADEIMQLEIDDYTHVSIKTKVTGNRIEFGVKYSDKDRCWKLVDIRTFVDNSHIFSMFRRHVARLLGHN